MCNIQCQETARGQDCEFGGVCGKSEELSDLQDLLIYTLKGISQIVIKGNLDIKSLSEVNHEVINSLFMTITNANFNDEVIIDKIQQLIYMRNELRRKVLVKALHDAATYEVNTSREMVYKASFVGVITNENGDIKSLKQLITFGLKGLAAYTHHALTLGKEMNELYAFFYEALAATLDMELSIEELLTLTMKTGEVGVKAMALLDDGNTSKYGNSEIEKRHRYTGGHVQRVTEYCVIIGEAMGLTQEELSRLRLAALMHDIGKIGIEDSILRKTYDLSDEEYWVMKKHTIYGAEIIQNIKHLWEIIPGVRGHHERFDGEGYPDGLEGDIIALEGRIIAVADTLTP